MSGTRTVSVVMPAHDVAPYVAEAVSSVDAQDWRDIQLIAVDDGSGDATPAILADLARGWTRPGRTFDLVRQANAGAAAARNAGLDRVRGAFVAFLDADDRWPADLVSRLVATLDAMPGLAMTFPGYRYVDADGAPTGVVADPGGGRYAAADLIIDNPVHSATGVLLRAEAVQAVGRFDTGLTACIDLDYWVRLGALGRRNIAATPDVRVDYRKRPGQITADWRRMRRNWLRVCDKLTAAGRPLSPRQRRLGLGRTALFWAALAHDAGDHRAARRLTATAWARDPVHVAQSPHGRVRTLAALATLLPARAHDGLQARFNARRRGGGA